ncbi:MAG: DUF4249 family protein [Ignavibacteriales bacterium]|nr:DUF4249 family protein [Ignavibacteriales bacterium]
MARLFFSSFFLLLFIIGCEDSFDPKGHYEEKMAVYSVLSTKSDIQYVRVYATYTTNGYDPFENTTDTAIRNATVTIQESNTAGQFTFGTPFFQFRDTTLQREDSSRYASTVNAYVNYSMKIKPGRSYLLSVFSQKYGQATSVITMPSQGSINASTFDIISPWGSDESLLRLSIGLSSGTRGYQVKFFVDYDVFIKDVGWKAQRIEIPQTILSGTDLTNMKAVYPQLIKRTSIGSGVNTVASYPFNVYTKIVYFLRQIYHTDDIKFKQAVLLLIQTESELYNYVNVVNGFFDPKSIRLDQPEYTNIKGGLGLFGGFVVDSTKFDLPSNFGFGR